ncbi:MAG: ABC transporter permease [Gemmatimonadota bacterium]
MNLLAGSITIGLLISLLALGVFVSYRVFDILDISVDGAFGVGAAVAIVLVVRGHAPLIATMVATLAGVAAGVATGVMSTRFRIQVLLAGILTTTALYSGNLYIMGGGDLAIAGKPTLFSEATALLHLAAPHLDGVTIAGTTVPASQFAALGMMLLLVGAISAGLRQFFRTHLGLAMRAAGRNPQMSRALGIDVGTTTILGLALANGLIALSGALFAEYQGFANVQMGIGMMVTGLAAVIMGEAALGRHTIGRRIVGAAAGAVVFRLLVAGALWLGLDPNALKLVTAIFVFGSLVVPGLLKRGAQAVSHG